MKKEKGERFGHAGVAGGLVGGARDFSIPIPLDFRARFYDLVHIRPKCIPVLSRIHFQNIFFRRRYRRPCDRLGTLVDVDRTVFM